MSRLLIAMIQNCSISRPIAPEDIEPGVWLAILNVIVEVLPPFCGEDLAIAPPRPIRIALLPWGAGEPLKVRAVCLPYVLIKDTDGDLITIDVRRYHLAQIPDEYARRAWRLLRKQAKAQRKRQK